jgi:hypothetical protein
MKLKNFFSLLLIQLGFLFPEKTKILAFAVEYNGIRKAIKIILNILSGREIAFLMRGLIRNPKIIYHFCSVYGIDMRRFVNWMSGKKLYTPAIAVSKNFLTKPPNSVLLRLK